MAIDAKGGNDASVRFIRVRVAGIEGTTLAQSTGWYRPQGQTTTTWVAELGDVFG